MREGGLEGSVLLRSSPIIIISTLERKKRVVLMRYIASASAPVFKAVPDGVADDREGQLLLDVININTALLCFRAVNNPEQKHIFSSSNSNFCTDWGRKALR